MNVVLLLSECATIKGRNALPGRQLKHLTAHFLWLAEPFLCCAAGPERNSRKVRYFFEIALAVSKSCRDLAGAAAPILSFA